MAKTTACFELLYGSEDPNAEALAVIVPDPDADRLRWDTGVAFKKAPAVPIRLVVYAGDEGTGALPDFCDAPIPVMSKRLFDTLVTCGVKNVDFYEATIVFEGSKKTVTTHGAINVVGRQSAAGGDLKVFRVKDSTNVLAVDLAVKTAIEKAAFPQLMFEPLDD